ncbi:hypothetical protein PR003_g6359 [Phytophthora rubi]|uniref:Uncharacterized protein n=1 Tax=Phytophthora rubi TaxID=129364 RepID=A0A6A4FX33_9STRA|nr:hypothetical protein PR002_g6381 [Phytophthora rubi]KAE9042389.1 hypothetical protein PR001_g6218 [Phytophthora rubi]KAE9348543.1 hypothetical protein PR003_g6359 [Phytophthora rubi]
MKAIDAVNSESIRLYANIIDPLTQGCGKKPGSAGSVSASVDPWLDLSVRQDLELEPQLDLSVGQGLGPRLVMPVHRGQ